MEVDDHQACTSMDVTEGDTPDSTEVQWRFSQVKGNIEPDEGITSDGEIFSISAFHDSLWHVCVVKPTLCLTHLHLSLFIVLLVFCCVYFAFLHFKDS